MLTVSLHGIQLHANVGLYPEEKITGNDLEIDVDVKVAAEGQLPFIDYVEIEDIVVEVFNVEGDLLETFAKEVHDRIRGRFPEVEHVRVAVRKMRPPLKSTVRYSQVIYEQ